MKKKETYLIIGVMLFFSCPLFGQQVISSAGTNASSGNVQISWTIGEPVIETFVAPNYILTQGFHQSKLVVTEIQTSVYPEMKISVYPNPVLSCLKLETVNCEKKNLALKLYDADGKLVLQKQIENTIEIIDMNAYASGIYLLSVAGELGFPMKSFKIVKD